MPFGLRLSLLLLIGCAEGALVVPDSDWRTVPAPQRDAIDRTHQSELAAAHAELTAATASLAAFQRAPATQRAAPARAAAPADPDEALARLARDLEQSRADALRRVNAAAEDKQRTDLAWRRLRVDEARAQIDMTEARNELTRAQAIDRNMPGNDTYDTAPVRGQFSRVQRRWYAIAREAHAARDAFEHASADLASAKEAYAQLMRSGPIRLPEAGDAGDRFELPRWSITRSDIRRRRGLRHFIDETNATPQLRKVAIQLSPPPRVRPAAAPPPGAAPAPPAVSPTANSPGGDAIRGNPPMASHPADRAGDPAPAVSVTRPAARTAPPIDHPSTSLSDHPADRAAGASPGAGSVGKPTGSARTVADAPGGHPADRAARSEQKTAPAPSAPSVAAGTRAVEPSHAPPPAGSATGARSAARSAGDATSSTPGTASSAARGATSAAKPVERPISESDARSH